MRGLVWHKLKWYAFTAVMCQILYNIISTTVIKWLALCLVFRKFEIHILAWRLATQPEVFHAPPPGPTMQMQR